MSVKTINPNRIRAVKADYKDMSQAITSIDGSVADESEKTLEEGNKAIKKSSQSISKTVKSLNDYLNGVADAFEQSDLKMANHIDKGTMATFKSSNKNYNKKATKAYGKLPG